MILKSGQQTIIADASDASPTGCDPAVAVASTSLSNSMGKRVTRGWSTVQEKARKLRNKIARMVTSEAYTNA